MNFHLGKKPNERDFLDLQRNQRNTYVWRMYRIQERLSSEDARLKSIDRSLNLLTNYQQFKRLKKKQKKRTTENIYDR